MSKVRQAIAYERQMAEAQDRAQRELVDAQLAGQKELLQQAIAYERKYTDGQFGQLNLVAQDHRIFHEREHLLYEDAIEKASTALSVQLGVLQAELDRMREEAHHWVPVARYEREHKTLEERLALSLAAVEEKVAAEQKVTVRQNTQQEMLDKISQTNRWMIGLAVTVGLSLFGTALHVFGVL